MRTAQELEPIIREAVDTIIQNGYVLISGDWGVHWDASTSQWAWDPAQTKTPGCCPIAALLLVQQPHLAPELHQGDPYDAAVLALDVDGIWLRDFNNGFEAYRFQGNWSGAYFRQGYEEAYELGQRMAAMYRPVPCEILAPTSASNSSADVAASG